jgi:hypothetical protein
VMILPESYEPRWSRGWRLRANSSRWWRRMP